MVGKVVIPRRCHCDPVTDPEGVLVHQVTVDDTFIFIPDIPSVHQFILADHLRLGQKMQHPFVFTIDHIGIVGLGGFHCSHVFHFGNGQNILIRQSQC